MADPNPSLLGAALVSSISAVVAAFIAGAVALFSNSKSNRTAGDMSEYKSATDRDLERLKARLEHGRLVNSTQWNAAFNAYQALWKSIVLVRENATRVVMLEGELSTVGLHAEDVSEAFRLAKIEESLSSYQEALNDCVMTINEHAPFYAAEIRRKANEAHSLSLVIYRTNMAMLVSRMKGESLPTAQAVDADTTRRKELIALVICVDLLEEMIRKQLNEVSVVERP